MFEYAEIFQSRLRVDSKQQPRWQETLAALDQWLTRNPPHYPYGRDCSICPVPELTDVCKGPPAKLDQYDFLYRISGVGSVIRPTNSQSPFRTNAPELNWDILRADQGGTNAWLPLSNYITGFLPGRRNFTWWTPFDLSASPVLPNAHRVGLHNDWIPPNTVILRIDLRGYDIASFGRVPTAIDGFDSPIFYATLEGQAGVGISIDLRTPESLRLGEVELVTDEVFSGDVEILPIYLGTDSRKLYPVDEEAVISHLVNYYAALAE